MQRERNLALRHALTAVIITTFIDTALLLSIKKISRNIEHNKSALITHTPTEELAPSAPMTGHYISHINLVKVSTINPNNTGIDRRQSSDRYIGDLYRHRHYIVIGSAFTFILLGILFAVFYRHKNRPAHPAGPAETKINDSASWQKTILENMIDGVITIDRQGIVQTINPAGERIFGYPAAEVVGRNVKLLMPSPWREEHDAYLDNYLRTGQARIIGIGREVQGLHKDGHIIPLDLAVSEININGQRLFTGIARNITDRIAAEKALQASASRLQTVLDNVVDGIITINSKGIVQSFNPAAEKIFAYKAEEVVGRNISMLMPNPSRAEHDGYLENYMKNGRANIIGIGREVEGRRKDGSIFPLDLAVSEMNIDGETMFSGIVRDITERKQVEKMKNEFISTVSHELRTPLTSIRGSLGLVMSGTVGKLPDGVKEMLTITANNTERLLLLINDILDIQKIESGMMAFHFHSLDLKTFLQQAITSNQSYADQYNVRFVLKSCPEHVRAYADEDRLMQVMNNLMSNAAKFSANGDTIELSMARHEGTIRISVSDHGPGIPDEFRDKLYDKFTQYDSTDKRQKGGTGLGLSITRLIVEKHGGRIDYVSKPQVGTTFYIELPELISELSADILPAELKNKNSPRILIVEDDHDVAALLQRMLAENGFNSDIAYSAADARQLLRQNAGQYNAMTLDIILPDEDGIRLLSSLRQNDQTRDLPVIVISIQADEAKRQLDGGAIGILDWISKPIDPARLRRVVKHAAGAAQRPRVLHVEDEQDIHYLVSKMLQHDCELVWTTTVSAAKEILQQESFELILLDIGLPDGSGLDLLEAIECLVNPPRVVIFSAQNIDPQIARQVSSVLIKSHTSNEQLLATITRAMSA